MLIRQKIKNISRPQIGNRKRKITDLLGREGPKAKSNNFIGFTRLAQVRTYCRQIEVGFRDFLNLFLFFFSVLFKSNLHFITAFSIGRYLQFTGLDPSLETFIEKYQ